ncbi:MAG: CxxxxCH/CxxCH domain-containing protein [Nitrospirae bacterium]|nr:CxxxxCH/CxxCH domain-containing protein [Nitrospirota bacterium]
MKKILILIGILLVGLAVSVHAQVLDAPHNVSSTMICADCHNIMPNPYNDSVCLSCHNNDTGSGYSKNSAPKVLTHSSTNTSNKYGIWERDCIACHFRQAAGSHGQLQRISYGTQTYLVTGTVTSVATNPDGSTTYGYNNKVVNNAAWTDAATWGKKSANAAGGTERGLIFYKTPISGTPVAGKIVSATDTSITVTGNPGAVSVGNTFALIYGQFVRTSVLGADNVNKVVKFFSNTGQNSFAYDESLTGTDPTPNGICQVCHTLTEHWRADGSRSAQGVHASQNGANCVTCHKHEEGFQAAGCNTCHGFPPINATAGGPDGLVSSPAATGSITAGAHNRHFNGLGIDCADCHYNSRGSGPTHNDGTIQAVTIGFSLFSGAIQGGSYDGQSGVDYNYTGTSTVSNTGTMQCGNLYCHSTGQGSNGGALTSGDYKTPTWTGSVVCGDCHKAVMDSGSHTAHIGAPLSKTCSECHKNAGEGTASHANAVIEVAFNADPFSNSASYSQTPNTPGNGYGTCATVYCHSIGQRSGGAPMLAGTSDYKTPSWGGAATTCGSCHASPMTSGSHTQHLSVAGYNCATCHTNAGSGTIKHADGSIDTEFNAAQAGGAGSYSQAGAPGNGYGTCSTVFCHGTISPQWGTDLTGIDTCTKCHGTPTIGVAPDYAKAPPADTAGNTLATGSVVGAHQTHLRALSNIANPVACNECHKVPATVTEAGHIDSALPAELTFGSLAKTGSISPVYSAGQCSTTYCHGGAMPKGTSDGANRTPSWNDTSYLTGDPLHDCAQCHGYPPAAIAAHNGAGPTSCIICHDHVNSAGTGFVDVTKHINGTMDGGADNCSDCHTNANLSLTHQKHVDVTTILAGKKLSLNNYGEVWFYGVSYVSGNPKFGCGYCHPSTVATHMNGIKNLNFDAYDVAASGTVKAKNAAPEAYTQNTGVSVICSSIYCHSNGYDDGTGYGYQTTPDWYGGAFSGDKCANCHGNSPNSGGKPGSLSHYNPNYMGMGVVGGHFVGIHYKNVFTGTTGLSKDASLRQNAHGTDATSTTINCQTCHNSTVSTVGNDLNTVCSSCHTSPSKGTMSIDALSTTHINGTPDVGFAAGTINSKAQIRDDITSVTELNNSWLRNNGYKGGITSSDGSKTAASYNPGSKSCSSVACHNGNSVTWGAINITCNSCHTSLP